MKGYFVDPFVEGVREGFVFAVELFVAIVLAIPRAILAASEKHFERDQWHPRSRE